ncbi:hypothetical protein CYMTET_35971, partial [Cymbomonas tetramitiformis]
SHAVLRVTVQWGDGRLGRLTLVDCAGSERKEDSMYHNAERRKEAAEINGSLYALRECIRFRRMAREQREAGAKAQHVHVPYRSSSLTRVLMECFTKDEARMAVIATVSPNPTDTEHSIQTLRTACMISGQDGACRETKEDVTMIEQMEHEAKRQVAPVHWTCEDIKMWLSRVNKGAFKGVAERVPASLNGRAFVRMNTTMLANMAGVKDTVAEEIYHSLRKEIAKVDAYMAQRRQEARDTAARAKSGAY